MTILGFILFTVIFVALVESKCPNNCNNNGICDKYSRCTCADEYQGADCSERICPFGLAWSDQATNNDTAHALSECSNRGICNRQTGECQCMDGFTGSSCDRLTCSNRCNMNGVCYSMRNLAAKTRNQESLQYSYLDIWDAQKIQGCKCDYPYFGYDCSQRECSQGDDPLTTGQVNEIQLIRCIANAGSFVLYYEGYPSASIPHTASANVVKKALQVIPSLSNINVQFSLTHGTVCQLQTNIISIEFVDQFGPQNPLVPLVDSRLNASGGSVEVNADGATSWTDIASNTLRSVKGTKESDTCSNRGACDESTGVCSCYATNGDEYGSSDGYGSVGKRGDCGYVVTSTLTSVSTCPGIVQCSGHGVCDTESYRCICSSGWAGGDCSEKTCPQGRSWFSYPSDDNVAHFDFATCGNMGLCDKVSGKCKCRDGFYGEACEYMACGGGLLNPCSGHGRCMTMAQLALWSENNGDATVITYGSDPNNADTWDYDRIHGCLCDKGYHGYDCSLRDCPIGDDPGTYNDHVEVQLLQCIADDGNFTLSFRQELTEVLPYNITASGLKNALDSLSTIKNVNVYFIIDGPVPNGTLNYVKPAYTKPEGMPTWGGFGPNNTFDYFAYNTSNVNSSVNSSFCYTDGSQIAIIEFTHTHGDLPALIPDNKFLLDFTNGNGEFWSGVLNVFQDGEDVLSLQSIKGTTETAICNNRGLCDTTTGLCQCFEDWTSSDGARQGGPGFTRDCGYRNDKKYSSFNSLELPQK